MVSPHSGGNKEIPKTGIQMPSNRATPGKNGIAKYVITPHTVQQHDGGRVIAPLKDEPGNIDPPILSTSSSHRLTFPETVYKMVVETNESDPDVIHWILDGEAFVVKERVSSGRLMPFRNWPHIPL